jgi:hypothetical protein
VLKIGAPVVPCATGQCPVHQDRTTSNQPLSGIPGRVPLLFTGLSGEPAKQQLPTPTVDSAK